MTTRSNVAFYLAMVINLLVALLYPYEHGNQVLGEYLRTLIWYQFFVTIATTLCTM